MTLKSAIAAALCVLALSGCASTAANNTTYATQSQAGPSTLSVPLN